VAVTTEAQSGVLGAAARIVLRGNACPVVHALLKGVRFVEVQIVTFPETKVAAIEHWGQASLEHDTVRKLVAWKLEQKLFDPAKYRSYGVHYTDPRTTPASEHHVGGPCARTWRQRFPRAGLRGSRICRCLAMAATGVAQTTGRRPQPFGGVVALELAGRHVEAPSGIVIASCFHGQASWDQLARWWKDSAKMTSGPPCELGLEGIVSK
jgi:hypothetical protein